MLDPAMIQWSLNPEYQPPNAPQQPVSLPQAFSPQAFNPPPQNYGPMQNLAMQMAGYPGPSGVRGQQQLGASGGGSGGAPSGGQYDGADTFRGGSTNPWLANTGGGLGSGGGNAFSTNQSWMNSALDNAVGYGPPGGSFDLGALSGGGELTAAAKAALDMFLRTGSGLGALGGGIYGYLDKMADTKEYDIAEGPLTVKQDGDAPHRAAPAFRGGVADPAGDSGGSTSSNVYRRQIPFTRRRRPGTLGR